MRILVTGVTGQVAFPIAKALAREHDVWGLARLRRPGERERLEAAGVRAVAGDLAAGRFDELPAAPDAVLHFAVAKSGKWDLDLAANAEGLGLLMERCRDARALVHCSSTAVYAPAAGSPRAEDAPLGDHHGRFLPTYSICKIAAEAMARFVARAHGIPTTIARLNVPYGDGGGWPALHLAQLLADQPIAVHPERPNVFHPIHEDDLVRMAPRLVEIAAVPATIVNWAGSEPVALEEWCALLGEEVGRTPRFVESERAVPSAACDLARMHALLGPTRVGWRDGMRRMVAARARRSP
jgi:nucleoside-diphosphate-sugar epimerase